MRPTRIAITLGALGSVAMMLYVGRHNDSWWLLGMFILWDIFPFAVLAFAETRSATWPPARQSALRTATWLITALTLGVYGYFVFVSTLAKPAAPFLIVPVVALVLLVAVLGIGMLKSGSNNS